MTDKLRTAAQRALEALSMPCDRWNSTQSKIVNDAITALRFALAEQPEEQQREWQGLFFDAVYEAWHSAGMDLLGGDWNTFAKTLEDKLKETK